jgi:hypothetical protein
MTNDDLYKVKNGIAKCNDIVNVANFEFAYTMAKIEDEVTKAIILLEKARKNDEYKEYLKEKEQLDSEHIIFNSNNTPIIINGQVMLKSPKVYYSKLDELNIKFKSAIDRNAAFINKLSEEYDGVITKLPKAYIPAQLTVEQVKLLYPVIVDSLKTEAPK